MIFPWRSTATRRPPPKSEPASAPGREAGFPVQPILTADALLKTRGGRMAEIQELCGFPADHFNALAMPLLRSVAEWCQAFSASESHHHARPFGLLDHTLEVATLALRLRRGVLLPDGASAETIAQLQDRWTFAVLAAALIHDLGKPAIDQSVTLFARGSPTGETWNPWAGPVTHAKADAYLAIYRRDRRHRLHDRAKPMFCPWWVPPIALHWMSTDMDLLAEWVAVLHGEPGGALAAIVAQADGASVARDLQGAATDTPTSGPRPEAAAAPIAAAPRRDSGTRPLHERLLMALRHLIQEGELPLNRNGAAGWVTPDGLWMVSKRTADALRQNLMGLGVGGIPTSNDRIFDVLQEHGILIPCGDRAIWKATVSNGEWRHTLTMLRFSLAAVWPDPAQRPDWFSGTIELEGHTATTTQLETAATAIPPDSPGEIDPPWNHGRAETAAQISVYTQEDVDDLDGDQGEADAGWTEETLVETPSADPEQPDAVRPRAAPGVEGQFLQWLREGVSAGRLETNTKNARIHRIAGGLVLVSPAVFQDFAAQSEIPIEWKNVQTRVRKLGLHRKTVSGENFHTFLAEGQRKSGMLKGMLFPDPGSVLPTGQALAVNPYIKLLS